MTAPDHDHDRTCAAVQYDPDTGAYTGTRAYDPDNCAECRRELMNR